MPKLVIDTQVAKFRRDGFSALLHVIGEKEAQERATQFQAQTGRVLTSSRKCSASVG